MYLPSETEASSLMLTTTANKLLFQCCFILRVIFYILQGRESAGLLMETRREEGASSAQNWCYYCDLHEWEPSNFISARNKQSVIKRHLSGISPYLANNVVSAELWLFLYSGWLLHENVKLMLQPSEKHERKCTRPVS